MAKQPDGAVAAVVLFLTVLGAVGWVPSATAQPFSERSTLVNLRSSAISLAVQQQSPRVLQQR